MSRAAPARSWAAAPPDPAAALPALLDYARAVRWGKSPMSRKARNDAITVLR